MHPHLSTQGRHAEQRASRRRALYVRCRIQDELVDRHAWLSDLSQGGARVLTAAPPCTGSYVRLTLSLPEVAEPIAAEGRVVWRAAGFGGRGGVMGIEFAWVSASETLAEVVHRG